MNFIAVYSLGFNLALNNDILIMEYALSLLRYQFLNASIIFFGHTARCDTKFEWWNVLVGFDAWISEKFKSDMLLTWLLLSKQWFYEPYAFGFLTFFPAMFMLLYCVPFISFNGCTDVLFHRIIQNILSTSYYVILPLNRKMEMSNLGQ